MPDPLSQTEISTLSRGVQGTPWHLVSVDVFDRPAVDARLGIDELRARVLDRLPYAPRFRQRVRETVTGLDWVDDVDFDIDRHLRQMTLESPGELRQITDLVAAGLTEAFDSGHPQWELTLVDGLVGGQVALLCRSHPALVDGGAQVHLLHELYDERPVPDVPRPQPWVPDPAPNDDLMSGMVGGLQDPLGLLGRVSARLARGMGHGVELLQQQAVPRVFRNQPVVPTSRYAAGAVVQLAAINRVRDFAGCTTHDVIVALVVAGLRQWQTHLGADPVDVVALVPLAVQQRKGAASSVGCQVAPQFVTLPVRATSPQGRIDQIASLTRSRIDSGYTVCADQLTRLSGFAPPTLHALAARSVTSGRAHDVFISNAPGPDSRRYLGAWQMHSSYPLVGLADSQDVTVSVTSYDGRVCFGAAAAAPVQVLVDGIVSELNRLDGGHR